MIIHITDLYNNKKIAEYTEEDVLRFCNYNKESYDDFMSYLRRKGSVINKKMNEEWKIVID